MPIRLSEGDVMDIREKLQELGPGVMGIVYDRGSRKDGSHSWCVRNHQPLGDTDTLSAYVAEAVADRFDVEVVTFRHLDVRVPFFAVPVLGDTMEESALLKACANIARARSAYPNVMKEALSRLFDPVLGEVIPKPRAP